MKLNCNTHSIPIRGHFICLTLVLTPGNRDEPRTRWVRASDIVVVGPGYLDSPQSSGVYLRGFDLEDVMVVNHPEAEVLDAIEGTGA